MNVLGIIFIVAWLIIFYIIWSERELERLKIEKNRFENAFLDGLHRHGHIFPLKHFTDNDEELTKKGEVIKERLRMSGLYKYFTVRSYMAFTFLFLLFCLSVGGGLVYILQYSESIIEIFLGVKIEDYEGVGIRGIILLMMLFLTFALFPNLYLKNRSKKVIAASAKELPMLQMFVILMLRADKTISEILYALSRLNSNHKEVFMQGYRIYVRSPQEGMEYLRNHFSESRFADMFDLLEDVSVYAKKETIVIMEKGMDALVAEANDIRRKNDLTGLVYSQITIIIPLLAVILLIVVPILDMAIRLFTSAISF